MKDLEKRSLLNDDQLSTGGNSTELSDTHPGNGGFLASYNSTGEKPSDNVFDDSYQYNGKSPSSLKSNDFSLSRRHRNRSVHIIEDGITLSWKNIKVHADLPRKGGICGCLKRNRGPPETKQILKGVNGVVRPGSFLVIMGASGSGKTTLLNVLTRRNLGLLNVQGDILANGKSLGGEINSVSGYIQQDDLFVGTLTVGEHLWFNARLRMGKQTTDARRHARIQDVMTEMGLKKCENTVIGIPGMVKGISGGEKKRLAFASELLTRPPIMFCDEPTSGLDSFMALNIVESLKYLATNGHTILCTIHQPSSEVFSLFDQILLMAGGRVAFMGPTNQLGGFFSDHGYICPPNYNPADFFIMNLAIIPGQEKECRENVKAICDSFEESHFSRAINHQIDEQEVLGKDKFIVEMDKVGANGGSVVKSDENANKNGKERRRGSKYAASWCQQFSMCFWRSSVDARRNKRVLPARILQLVLQGILVGVLWFRQPYNNTGVSNINGAMFTFMVQVAFNTAFAIATAFSREFPVFLKEHQDRQYAVSAYYLGKILVDLPVIAFATFLYTLTTYWMIGLNPGAVHFFIESAAVVMLSLTAASYGHMASAIFPNPQMALTLLPFILGLTLLCSGFLIKQDSIPVVFLPLSWVSSFKYVYEILIINQWRDVQNITCEFQEQARFLRDSMNLTTDYSSPHADQASNWCVPNGLAIVYSFQYDPDRIPVCFVTIVAIAICVQVCGYFSFRRKTSK